MLHCDLRVRWTVASDLRFRAAICEPKAPSFCGISGDLAPSTRKSLAIAIVRFWCAKPKTYQTCTKRSSVTWKNQARLCPVNVFLFLLINPLFSCPSVSSFWLLLIYSSSFVFLSFVPHIKFYNFIVCFTHIVVVFSLHVLHFTWLYVSFYCLVFMLFSSVSYFSSLLSTSHVLTFLVLSHLIPTLSFFFIMFLLLPLLLLPLLLSSFDYVLFPHDTPKKDTKSWFCFCWQNRAGFSEFRKNDFSAGNKALCCRVQTKHWKILFVKVSKTYFYEHWHINFQRPYNQPIEKGTPSLKTLVLWPS